MKTLIAGVVSAAYLIATVVPALASSPIAEVSGVRGKVLVNHGKGFELATGSVELNAGDKVMVGANSSAHIDYLNVKCSISANAASVLTVSANAPCKSGMVVGSVDNVFAIPTADPVDMVPPPVFPILPLALVGTAAVVGGVLILSNCRRSSSAC